MLEILPQLLVNSIITGSIYALASSGLTLIYGLLGVLNFAHGHLMMLGSYFFYLLHIEYQWGVFPAGLATAIATGFVAVLTLNVFVLPFTRYSYLMTLVSTIALSTILESLVSIFFGVNVKSLSSGNAPESLQVGSVFITPTQIVIILSAVALLFTLGYLIHLTSLGRNIRALYQNPFAAQALGIPQQKFRYFVFVAGVLLAAYAGVLIGYETNMQPTMGSNYTIKVFAVMILGGLGNIWGTIAGSFILGLIENLSIGLDFWGYSLPSGYKDAFAYSIILFVLLFRPKGLFQRALRRT